MNVLEISAPIPWSEYEKAQIEKALTEISRAQIKKILICKLQVLKNQNPENLLEISKLENEIASVNNKPLSEIALPIDQDYDWVALAENLNTHRKPTELRSFWRVYLHPSINKSEWTEVEYQELLKVAAKHNYQKWEKIAKELNTGRSEYQCFVYYRSNQVREKRKATENSGFSWNKKFGSTYYAPDGSKIITQLGALPNRRERTLSVKQNISMSDCSANVCDSEMDGGCESSTSNAMDETSECSRKTETDGNSGNEQEWVGGSSSCTNMDETHGSSGIDVTPNESMEIE